MLFTRFGKGFAPASIRSFAVVVEFDSTASVKGVPEDNLSPHLPPPTPNIQIHSNLENALADQMEAEEVLQLLLRDQVTLSLHPCDRL